MRTGACADATAPPTGWTVDAGDGDIILRLVSHFATPPHHSTWNVVAEVSEPLGHSLSRLSFGVHDQKWQGGLLKEVKRLKQEQDQVLVLVRSPIFLRSWCLARSR